jgi:hypothetical protein|tara:strand:+ start:382 stop:600 length:219 start_codon:yes stop_codon:yes gene_type:complete
MKLFQVHTGFYDPNISDGFYEGHTNIFVCAKDEKEARKVVKEKKEYKRFKMHIDGIQEITTVDNYKVELTKI